MKRMRLRDYNEDEKEALNWKQHPVEVEHLSKNLPTSTTTTRRTFVVQPPSNFDGKFPFFKRPEEMGHFSLNIDRSFVNDARHLKRYHPPANNAPVNFDLRAGFESFIKRDDNVKGRLNNVMNWVVNNKSLFNCKDRGAKSSSLSGVSGTNCDATLGGSTLIESLGVDFLAWRGHFTKFLCTPYEKREGWLMAASLFRGTVYISEVETAEDMERRLGMNQWEQLCTYGGYKFEQYVTRGEKMTVPNPSQPVNNLEAYCSVIRTRLDQFKLLYSGEVDCCQPDSAKSPPENYRELKTSRKLYTKKNEDNFYRFKLLRWWAQSFLVGIPEVICGFRNDDNVVEKLHHFKTLDMPRESRGHWNGSVCFNFLVKLLKFFKSVVVEDDPSVVYLFERRPGATSITHTVHSGEEHRFIPDWYVKEFVSVNQEAEEV